jgi:hypothetical protein
MGCVTFRGAQITQSVQRQAAGWTAGVHFPAGTRDISLLYSVLTGYGGQPSLLYYGYRGLFHWRYSGRGVKLATHLHLVPRSRRVQLYHHTSLWGNA